MEDTQDSSAMPNVAVTQAVFWRPFPQPQQCPSLACGSRDEVKVLRQRQVDRRLEEAGRLRVDEGRAVRGEEDGDLLLSPPGNPAIHPNRPADFGPEHMPCI